MRAKMAVVKAPRGRHRHRRHRRRRFRLLQCLDPGRDHHRRLRRAGRQARQPRGVVDARAPRTRSRALGVKIGLSPEAVERCIREAGIGFMMAPTHHASMRHVGPTRVELGTRTIFNLLGPLSNPAGVKRQMIGVFSAAWLEPMAEVLRNLGSERVWVTHGVDGLDEITVTAPTRVVELKGGALHAFELTPEDGGPRPRPRPRRSRAATRRTTPGADRRPRRRARRLSRHRRLTHGGRAGGRGQGRDDQGRRGHRRSGDRLRRRPPDARSS